MAVLEQLDTIAGPWNNEPNEDQSEDENSDTGTYNIPGPNEIGGIQEGDPSTVNDETLSNMDEEMPNKFFSGVDEKDADSSTCEDTIQLNSPMRKIPRPDNLFSARV